MKQIIEHVRGYNRASDRKRAIRMLTKHGFNYFLVYRDTQSDYALWYSKAERLREGEVSVQ